MEGREWWRHGSDWKRGVMKGRKLWEEEWNQVITIYRVFSMQTINFVALSRLVFNFPCKRIFVLNASPLTKINRHLSCIDQDPFFPLPCKCLFFPNTRPVGQNCKQRITDNKPHVRAQPDIVCLPLQARDRSANLSLPCTDYCRPPHICQKENYLRSY